MSFFDPVAAIAATQHGTITRDQLRRSGLSDRQLRTLVAKGVLIRSATAVYRLAGSPEGWHQRLAIALHQGGPLAVIGKRSAAGLLSLDRYRPGHVEIVGPWGGSRTGTSTTIHRSTDLPTRDRTVCEGLPVTTATRTLIDMGQFVGQDRLGAMIDDAVRRELTTYEELGRRCAELARPGRRGIPSVREVLSTRPDGVPVPGSAFETRVKTLLLRAGVAAPVAQHAVTCGPITYVLDFAWTDQLVALECDGFRFHRTPEQLDWDDRRRNELGLRGWLVHHVTWKMLMNNPAGLVDGVRRALASRRAG